MNKGAALDIWWRWPEYSFLLLFVIGFILAMFAKNTAYVYIFIIIAGFITGRYLQQKKTRPPIPIYLLTYGFVFGFILALIITKKADWRLILIIFIIANMLSYYLHDKGYITS